MSTCGTCPANWTGLKMAHCSACHQTFTTPSNFDKHRRQFACEQPSSVGLVVNGRGHWGGPPRPDDLSEDAAPAIDNGGSV